MKNKICFCGEYAKILIVRKNGEQVETLIDNEDVDKIIKFNRSWYVSVSHPTGAYYIHTDLPRKNGVKSKSQLHRFLMGNPENMVVDHINHNTLDNRKFNLRIVTKEQNTQNRKGPDKDNLTGYRGVYKDKRSNKYIAGIKLNGKRIHVGTFNTPEEAARAAKEKRMELLPYSQG